MASVVGVLPQFVALLNRDGAPWRPASDAPLQKGAPLPLQEEQDADPTSCRSTMSLIALQSLVITMSWMRTSC